MIRKIIKIDEEKCTGCRLCASACHEGAIEIIDGKAKLVREHFCDGFGDCLPKCPEGAITFEEREAPAYDEDAVKASKEVRKDDAGPADSDGTETAFSRPLSRLKQWPCQIKLMPAKAGFFDSEELLIAADCTAYAYAGMHEDFMKNRITLIGCPKLDGVDYTDKLTAIIRDNDIRSVTLVRMEVPCCGGLQRAAENAIKASGKLIPRQVVTISIDGKILSVE